MGVLQAKEITLGRLRRVISGAKTEKSHNLLTEVGGAKPQAESQRARAQSRPGLSGSPGKAARQEVFRLRTLTASTRTLDHFLSTKHPHPGS